LNWLWHNKEWLFSGIGVSFVAAVAGLVYRATHRRNAALSAASASSFPAPTRFTKPTPREMMAHIGALPPFQRDIAAEAYKGLKVCWQARFLSVEKDWIGNEGLPSSKEIGRKTGARTKHESPTPEIPAEWIVVLKHYDPTARYGSTLIFCHGIRLEVYPQLKFLHADEPVVVSGTVESVKSSVTLAAITLEFISTE
jgi:hypothetical protein